MKKKTRASLVGAWRHHGKGPEVKFRCLASADGLRVRFEFPSSKPVMTEKAWRAFFRFMLSTMQHARPEAVSEEAKRFVKWKRDERRKRWLKMRKRRRHLRINPSPPKPKPDPIPDFVPTGPSAELLETAKAKLEQDQ